MAWQCGIINEPGGRREGCRTRGYSSINKYSWVMFVVRHNQNEPGGEWAKGVGLGL